MPKMTESQEVAAMIAELEALDSGFDWLVEPGDDQAAVVWRTYKDMAPAIVEDLGLRMQRALAAIGPEGAAPMLAVITADSIDLRPA